MVVDEALFEGDDLVGASVCRELSLNASKNNEGTVGAATLNSVSKRESCREDEMQLPEGRVGLGNTNRIVERQPERLMSVVTALVVEEVGLDVLKNREEYTASLVGGNAATGTGDAFGNSS